MRTVLALLVALLPSVLAAHETRPAIATATLGPAGAVEIVISLNLEAVMAGIGADHADTSESPQAPVYDRLRSLEPEALRESFEGFAPRFVEGVAFGMAPLALTGVEIPALGDPAEPRLSEIMLEGRLPPATETVAWRFDRAFGDSVIRIRQAGAAAPFHSEYVAAAASRPMALEVSGPRPRLAVFAEYLRVGFGHIVPKGLDHMLFVVGLFLLAAGTSALLWQISAFTLAHTITLGLGAAGWTALPASVVEPLIALSIVYVGVENLLSRRLHPWRPALVFGFGLLHGLGFAGVLGEIGLPRDAFVTGLVGFNLGVEAGQLAVIGTCFLLVGWARKARLYQQAVVWPGSIAIAAIAAYWSVERAIL